MSSLLRSTATTIGFLCLTAAALPALAANWVVNPTGIGDDFPNIQAAIASPLVVHGDTILLKNGTYTGTGNRDINFLGKNIVVRSMNMNPLNRVIDCQGSGATPRGGFLFTSGESSAAYLQAIKIVNGYRSYSLGAGIYVNSTSSPTIDNCIIQSYISEGSDGGGAEATNKSFDRSIIWGNCASFQADGIFGDATVTLTCCCVDASGVGGAVVHRGAQVFSGPQFCAPLGCNSAPTTGGDHALTSTSPCPPARVYRPSWPTAQISHLPSRSLL